jgi:hypothetical protein
VEHSAELLRCLRDGDVTAIRRLYREIAPHLPQPSSDVEAWASLHHARTQVEALPLKLRAYSHRWLLDQGLPSGLPDALKPLAERMYQADRYGRWDLGQFDLGCWAVSGACHSAGHARRGSGSLC